MNKLILLVIFEFALFLIAFYFSGNDIMAPSVLMVIMFLISTLVALMNATSWNVDYSMTSVIIIVTGLFVFILSEVMFRYLICGQLRGREIIDNSYETECIQVSSWKLNILIIIDALICFSFLRIIIKTVGSLSNLTAYFVVYRRLGIASLAESGESMTSGYINHLLKIVSASGYVSVYLLANNLITKKAKVIDIFKYILIIVLSVMPSVMTGGRTGALKILSAFLIIYYIVWHQKNGWSRNLSWKYVKYGLIILVIGSTLFYYSLNILGRVTERSLFDYASRYLGSSICMFDLYLKEPVETKMFGEESLFSLRKIIHFLGFGENSTSYNLEFRYMGNGKSNVYTFFRRPYHDFGLVGMYIFTAFVACLFSYIYFKNIKNKPPKNCAGWVLLMGYLYYWIVVSSIVQYSSAYISAGTVTTFTLVIVLYYFLTTKFISATKVKVKLK